MNIENEKKGGVVSDRNLSAAERQQQKGAQTHKGELPWYEQYLPLIAVAILALIVLAGLIVLGSCVAPGPGDDMGALK